MIEPHRTEHATAGAVVLPFPLGAWAAAPVEDDPPIDAVDLAKRPETLARLRALLAR